MGTKITKSSVSLREIADETGFSITTVSRALRKQGEISELTRQRVLKTAKRLRYRPNMLATGIQTGKTHTMGVMVPPYDSYWTDVLYGIHDGLTSDNYSYINTWCELDEEHESYSEVLLDRLYRLIDRRVDGIILWPHLAPLYTEHIEELETRNLPVVTIDHEISSTRNDLPMDMVETDEKYGAELVADYLYGLGHRHIAHLAWDESYQWAKSRKLYFQQALQKRSGTTCTIETIPNMEDAEEKILKLLCGVPRPTALYACSDHVAKVVYSAAAKLKMRIPEDLSVVGYADLEFSSWIQPALTTVRQHGRKTGKTAAQMLIERAEETIRSLNSRRVLIECELIVRGSAGPVQ
jgi:LacI family transcriptional regulator